LGIIKGRRWINIGQISESTKIVEERERSIAKL